MERTKTIPDLALIHDACFQEHRPPAGHPERPQRLQSLEDLLTDRAGPFHTLPRLIFTAAKPEDILRVHTAEHLEKITQTQGLQHTALDPDTHTSARSYETALLASGASMRLIDAVFLQEARAAFACVRPPGHHAESRRAMGFCLFNNIAVAAAYAREKYHLKKIAIIDWDVHHGNGTQEIFYADPQILYLSTHQYPFYPGTGHYSEIGSNEGRGFTINIPLPAGLGDSAYADVFQEIIAPIVSQFAPELVLVSAGYDAFMDDPLGGMHMSAQGFAILTRIVRQLAQNACPGRLAFVLEGGYDLQGLSTCVAATLKSLMAPPSEPVSIVHENLQAAVITLIEKLKNEFNPYWNF